VAAQSVKGTISGIVTDANGDAVPGATGWPNYIQEIIIGGIIVIAVAIDRFRHSRTYA